MKLAMIGSYGHTGIVLRSLPHLPDVQLVAVSRYGSGDKLGFYGKGPAWPERVAVYENYQQMIREVHPDIVSVCMPLHRNAEASIFAARHGCHIIGEKPLATTLADLDALKAAVAQAGVKVCAMFEMRASAPYQTVRQVVQGGRIGEPILAFGQKSYPFGDRDEFYRTRETFGGTIPWVAIHALEFTRYCFGRDYRRVAAMHSNLSLKGYPGSEDNGGILLEFDGGGHAIISFDYLRPKASAGPKRRHGDDRLRIAGSEGIVEIVDEGTRVVLMTASAVEDVPLAPARDLFGEFVASIRGDGPCIVTPEESFRITEVALKARDAADAKKIVEL
ncbi:MAG: Gfo/Idh/MocA family oxidoreductase [Phycisphaerae bacterium]|jgi:predicted dehydrogenase